jgi:outer membrane protein OmpA-like peptidoglycan-associated protein/tetratricopeptide (TPR) repeat protein
MAKPNTLLWVKSTLLAGLFILISGDLFAQNTSIDTETFLYNSAKDFIEFEDYESALDIYTTLDSINPNQPQYVFGIGLGKFQIKDKPESLLFFLKAYQLGFKDPIILYYLGLSYHFNYDLDNASYYLKEYLTALGNTEGISDKKNEVLRLLDQIPESRKILEQRLSVDIENLGEDINSPYADYVPLVLSRDSILLFTSRREGSTGGKISHDGSHYEDIYMAVKKDNGEWARAVSMDKFNGPRHDANVAINKDETELYIFKANHNGNIYKITKHRSGKWSRPKSLKGINTRYWEGSIAFSPGEDTLYFSSDRPGGFGESDLYSATRDSKGKWINIKNMGPEVNSPLDDDAPFLYKDGKTFFFSSKGHNSIGGYDVFSTKYVDSIGWTNRKNVGFPINTIDDDIYFHLNGKASIGYFTSFRHSNFDQKSIGEKDIFQIVRPHSSPVYFIFKGRIYDEESKEPLPATVSLQNMEDSTAIKQKLVVDINSGKFRCDLQFEKKYKLTVSVGTKEYYSKELYFPYQPELFESFLDIPLKDIPTFKVRLHDMLENEPDSVNNVVLNSEKLTTVVLVRKVPFNDAELRNLLLSNRIPVSFRNKIFKQLEKTEYLDKPEEGNPSGNLFSDLNTMPNDKDMPVVFARLENEEKKDVKKIDVKGFLTDAGQSSVSKYTDSTLWNKLSEEEKTIVNRIANQIIQNDSVIDLDIIDELYYKTLTAEELKRINGLVAARIQEENKKDSTTTTTIENLYRLIDYTQKKILEKQTNVPVYNKEAWGILYTIEASTFRQSENKRFTFNGTVTFRSSSFAAPSRKLLLVDDKGAIYLQGITNENGNIQFNELLAGKRYHVLVDDYSIALLGQSRYVLQSTSLVSVEEDHLKFYNNLTSEEKRSVDRIIALETLDEMDLDNKQNRWEDPLKFDKLSQTEKDFIQRIRKYLSTKMETDSAFFMNNKDALQYEQLNLETREEYNRLIVRGVTPSSGDSIFYNKLSDVQRRHIEHLRETRKAKKTILEDILVSQSDADYWYVLEEIKTTFGNNDKPVKVSANITHHVSNNAANLQVALMDEFNQIVHLTETNDAGYFSVPSVKAGKKFKVLINKGTNIGQLTDYALKNLKIEDGIDDFYSKLSAGEKRIVDRIIAINLANEASLKNETSLIKDGEHYDQLTRDEKEFIERLRQHLFADTVTQVNTFLHKQDNSQYYNNLDILEREFVNRIIVKTHNDLFYKVNDLKLDGKDKVYFENLDESQQQFITHLQNQRRAKADIFAENPTLFIDKAWMVLDSVNHSTQVQKFFSLSGHINSKNSGEPVQHLPVMISTGKNEMIGMLSTDSTGYFKIEGLSTTDDHYLMAETKANLFDNSIKYILKDVQIIYEQKDSVINRKVKIPEKIDLLVLYFGFDSYTLKSTELQKLDTWLNQNKLTASQFVMQIDGHADATGGSEYNYGLSKRRANTVRMLLIERGINTTSLNTNAFGETIQRYIGKKSALNRRVEINVMGNN